MHPILQTSLVLNNCLFTFSTDSVEVPICDPGLKLLERPLVFVFEVFETGVELDAVDDFFPVAEGLVSDPDGVENVINIVVDAVFAAVVVEGSVVFDNVDDDVVDSDNVDAVVATVVASVVVVGADDDVVDSTVDDVAAVVGIVVISVVVIIIIIIIIIITLLNSSKRLFSLIYNVRYLKLSFPKIP